MGRPCKLTTKRKTAIIKSIEVGNYIETSCLAAGLDEATYYNYLKLGREDKAAGKETIYSDFLDCVKKAELKAEEMLVTTIKSASFKEWQAAAFLLERKNPKRWGRKEAIDHTIVDRPNTEEVQGAVKEILNDEQLLDSAEKILDKFSSSSTKPSQD